MDPNFLSKLFIEIKIGFSKRELTFILELSSSFNLKFEGLSTSFVCLLDLPFIVLPDQTTLEILGI